MNRLATSVLCGVLAIAIGCGGGDDSGDDDVVPDIDAATGTPDAPAPDAPVPDAGLQSTRLGTVAVSDVAALLAGGSGAAVSISFEDLSGGAVAPVYDDRDGTGAGCAVFVYDLSSQAPPPVVDEGAVTIGGTESPLPTCAFDTDAGRYLCVATAGTAGAGDTVVDDSALGGMIPENTALVSISGVAFSSDHVGMFLQISGFANPVNNGAFPIVAQGSGANQVVIANPASVTQAMAGDGAFAVLAGAGPTPANRDFLSGGANITIAKPAGTDTVALDETVIAAGDGFALASASADPNAIPTNGTAATFTCNGAGGSCGTAAVIAVSGHTTDADVTGLPGFAMPAATGKLATFSCAFFGDTATVPADAMTAILGADTTRVETRVFRFNLAQQGNTDGTNKINILVGHGHVGWTNVE